MDTRGASNVVGVVLLVGLVVVLASAVGTASVGVLDESVKPAPYVASAHGELTASGLEATEKSVLLVHEGGDAVNLSAVHIVVRKVGQGREGRLVGLPSADDTLDADEFEGDDVFDNRDGFIAGAITLEDGDGVWEAGESIRFRLAGPLPPGETVIVRMVHVKTRTVLFECTLTATEE